MVTQSDEAWSPARGYEDRYRVSTHGRIASIDHTLENRARKCIMRGRLLHGARSNRGYLYVCQYNRGKKKNILIHRIIAETFIPNPDKLPQVNHCDGNKLNNSVSNLEWCTPRGNAIHAHRMGLTLAPNSGPGEKSPAHKLILRDVIEIRRLYRDGIQKSEIARRYGVVHGTVDHIISGRTWVNEGVEILGATEDAQHAQGWR